MSEVSAREIRAMLQQRVDELLHKLFPGYSVTRPCFTPLNPTRADKTSGSFVIWTAGAAAGGFNEYSPNGPPASGDVIDLIGYVHGHHRDRRFALGWARDFLGIKAMDGAEIARAKATARHHVAATQAATSNAAAAKIARASALWRKTLPIAGSVAENYLASRRIPLVLVKNREDDLRFLPRLEHWKSAKWDGERKVEDGPHLPAMIAAVRNHVGDLTAVHCTFLRADGSGKADVSEAKLMRGLVKGSAVRIARGPDNLTPEEAAEQGVLNTLVLAEGIETALSCALALPEARVWAATGFRFFEFAPLDHPCIDRIVIAADNDDSAKAERELDDVVEALTLRGKSVSVMRPDGAKDFNDVMKESA